MEAVLVALLFRRRAFHLLPVFCSYVVWTLLSDASLMAVNRLYADQYFNVFLVETSLDAVLQFGVLVELAWSVLRPCWASPPRGAIALVALSVVAAGALVWPFATIPGFGDLPPEWRLLMRLQETCSILRVLFFVDLVGCSKVLEVGWRNRELQIAIGLGFYSLVSLTVSFLHSTQVDSANYHIFDQIIPASYLCSLSYWVVCFAQQKQEPRREFSPKMQSLLFTVARAPHATRVPLANPSIAKPRRRGEA
jgi:hypothetical protein